MLTVKRVVISKRVGAVLVAVGVVMLAVLALWLLPTWLTQHPHLTNPSDRYKAAADVRTGVVAFIAVLGGLGGLYYTSQTFRVSRDAQIAASKYASETLRLSEKGQITDRYSKAVDQLGDDSPEVCVGGVYALGHIMLDSAVDYERAVVAVLSAFIRRTAQRKDDLTPPWPKDEAERDEVKPSFRIQAALNVFVESRPLGTAPDLRDSDLRGARLRTAQLSSASFRRSYLHRAKLTAANLSGASLVEADLTEADFTSAILADADCKGARLTEGALTSEQLMSVRNGDKIEWVAVVPGERPQLAADPSPDPI